MAARINVQRAFIELTWAMAAARNKELRALDSLSDPELGLVREVRRSQLQMAECEADPAEGGLVLSETGAERSRR